MQIFNSLMKGAPWEKIAPRHIPARNQFAAKAQMRENAKCARWFFRALPR